MTPAELRLLADEATQWQWHWDDEGMSVEFQTEGDARLIALAPDLARLCAELGEALRLVYTWKDGPSTRVANRALAKLSELEVR